MFYLKNKEGNCFKEVESVSQKRALDAVGFVEYKPKAAEAAKADEAAKAEQPKAPAKKAAVKSK